MRVRLVASKTIYDASVATQQPVDTSSIYGHTKSLFDGAQQQMDRGTFEPVVDSATKRSIEALSWWTADS